MATVTEASVHLPELERLRKPWKFEGYPGFSRWMASSEDFLILRRFGQPNIRALLLTQHRISRKEELLLRIDEEAMNGPGELGDSSSLRHDPRVERERILDEQVPLLQQYSL
jgi:hypothetical protein